MRCNTTCRVYVLHVTGRAATACLRLKFYCLHVSFLIRLIATSQSACVHITVHLRKSMPFTNKQIVEFYFKTQTNGSFKCRCGKLCKQAKGAGFQNLISHLFSYHKDYVADMTSNFSSLGSFVLDKKTETIYGYLEWVIMADLPFTFVENDLTRKFPKLGLLSRSTFMKYLQGVTKEVEMLIKKQLPSKFGLIFDGWTDSSTATHFFAVFAVYPGKNGDAEKHLNAFLPLLQEEDLEANSQIEFLDTILRNVYGKSLEKVSALIADNAAVNVKIAQTLGVPMIGCYSHRLNLAVQKLLHEKNSVKRCHEFVKKMSGLKKSAVLRTKTPVRPVLQNDTRWSSSFEMLSRYFELKPFIDTHDRDLLPLSLSPGEEHELKFLYEMLKDFESVSKSLQQDGLEFHDARLLFNSLFVMQPPLEYFLGLSSNSVSKFQEFERALLKKTRRQRIVRL